jgi:EmrB/QacA subfamily drug resistance transporter
MTTISQPSLARGGRLDPQVVRLAAVLLTGILAVVLDTTIVTTGLRAVAEDLAAPISTAQWVTTGYLLTLGATTPVAGWLLDRFGGKATWTAALGLFLAGSLGASLAGNAPELIASRSVQGAAGGVLLPVMQTLLVRAMGGRPLGRMAALVSLPVLLGPVLGPLLGGLIVAHLSWRWMFWVNIPVCAAGLVLAWRLLPAGVRRPGARLDIAGFALLAPGIALALLGLSRVGIAGALVDAAVLAPLAAGAALVGGFVVHALLTAGEPLVDVRLLGFRSVGVSSCLMFLSGAALYGAMLLVPLYLQQVSGQDPVAAGLVLAPQGIGVLISRVVVVLAGDHLGIRSITVAGFVVVLVGTLPFAWADAKTSTWWLAAALVVRGVGLGAVTIPIMVGAFHGLQPRQIPHASILTRTVQQIGGSFGTALIAATLAHDLGAGAGTATAFEHAFWCAIGFTIFALLVAFALPEHRLQSPATEHVRRPAVSPRSAA